MVTDNDGHRIVNVNGLDWTGTDGDGGGWKRIAEEAGGTRLGCTYEEIPPGGQPAQYHYHTANEEALFVMDGTGTLRTPAGETGIESGDYVSFPVGEFGCHAVENTSSEPLKCLFFSTMDEPDIVVYPDSGKLHVVGGPASGLPRDGLTFDATTPFDIDDSESG
ncbi:MULTISPECIES: cupin domain-containing protein [unclassified Haladaptatus]|uniref:cupin domain-containing protein n=1 Tax=unclassified Haladaptatus TaxID=2622732 RepID=UPI00209BBDC2|nr:MULTISPECIES: cupin domain-containing protein [unclassified Haladaptatus]MCO8243911.1 cupin domain-containing protein [Haladaptatus sp. AB643]MCO8256446.1 cupin domain-containing protein [Haladaptatus sp. AB618]